jgi:hypothetical protein
LRSPFSTGRRATPALRHAFVVRGVYNTVPMTFYVNKFVHVHDTSSETDANVLAAATFAGRYP